MEKTFKAILLDMDGVLYRGKEVIHEALAFISAIEHLPHAFITNNPILTSEAVADRLQQLGFNRPDTNRIITSAEATALWLSRQKTNFRYFAVGAEGLHIALREYGVEDSNEADFVVIGEGAGIDYDKITTGVNLIQKQGARLVCTNPDHSVDGFIDGVRCVLPGGGALVAPFAIAAETTPVFIGKPHALLYQIALDRLGVSPQHCLMIGDRPDTDIAGAVALGMETALVRTGRFPPAANIPAELPVPDWDVENLDQLLIAIKMNIGEE